MSTFRRLLSLIAPFRWAVALAILLAFVTIGANVGLMAMSAYLISKSLLVTLIAQLSLVIVAVRVFAIGRAVLRYVERYLTHRTTFHILTRLRVWFYESVEPLAPARLQAYRSGDLLSRIVDDIETLENFYVRVVVPPLAAALVVGVATWIVGSFDRWIGLALLLYLLLTGVGLPLLTRRLSREPAGAALRTRAELSAALVDQIQGLSDLLAYGRGADYQQRTEALTATLHRHQERLALLRGASTGLAALLTGLAGATALGMGAALVAGGQLDGVFLAVLPLTAIASFEAVQPLSQALQMLEESQEAGRRLYEVIDAPPAVVDPPQPAPRPARFDLALRNLYFRYAKGEPWVLEGVNLALPAGSRLALVGPSGAGKTTLIRLLLRFWTYEKGSLCLGGRELRDYRADDVRGWIGVVSQHTHLFNTTIRDNLLLAAGDATDAHIVAVCRAAQIHDFIEGLPQGYDTRIGENGVQLSGGERQRLALARAMLKDAPLLILDEATTHLDPDTEARVLAALDEFMRGRTVLFISHEARALRYFERVLVLDRGQITGPRPEPVPTVGPMWDSSRETPIL